jgi:hypothetical protein
MSLTLAVDEEGEWIRTVKRDLHAGQRPPQALPEQPDLAQLFGFSTRAAGDRTIGYLRIYSFNVPIGRLDAFAAAVRRALRTPMDGLIVDVRGNPGGDAVAAERVLRALSPVPVKPQALEFVNTPRCVVLAGRMLSGRPEFAHNRRNALITAAQYVRSPPFDPAPDEPAQVYQGPAVLIIDSLSYSAAEIFAAGFEDHGLGKIVGTDPQTGGGGGNVLNYDALRRYDRTLPASVRGTSFEVALRRTLRVREGGGIVEDRGVVVSGSPTQLTAVDVLGGNDHLFEKTAERFGADVLMHPRTLRFGVSRDRRRFSVQPSGLRRVDVYVDGRPLGSVSGAKASFVRIPATIRKPQTVRFHGFVLDFPMAEPQVTAQWRRPDGG